MKKRLNSFIEFNIDADLIRAVIRQSGGWLSFQEMAQDIYNHGISGGFNGWIFTPKHANSTLKINRRLLN